MYQLLSIPFGMTESNGVIHLLDNTAIPFDPANTDYQQYLKWVAEGNEPLPANEGVA